MKKIYLYAIIVCSALLLTGCMKEGLNGSKLQEGDPLELELNFGASTPMEITVDTKSTLGQAAETKIYNMYVFIFASDGSKVYGKYFDISNLNDSSQDDYWEVTNGTSTTGTIHMKTSKQSGCTICGITNIDADMINISPELLSAVQTKDELYGMVAKLNQDIISRNGYFPMSGMLENQDTENISGTLSYHRLDAKITFNVRVAAGSNIANFTPLKWQVINVPKKSYVLEHGAYNASNRGSDLVDAGSSADDFFTTSEANYETSTLTSDKYAGGTGSTIYIHSFSFYMMENRLSPKKTVTSYSQRELQEKNNEVLTGTSSAVSNGEFEYANDYSTYVKFTGRVDMNNVSTDDAQGATLNAEVVYYVHLGDFTNDSVNNFDTFRNHAYTYNITIEDVHDIRVEVSNNYDNNTDNNLTESEPGAEGNVTIALETIYKCDAHYCSQVINFHAKNVKSDNITWMVKTPFNPNGREPVVVNGVDVTAGIDYEWVEFRVNGKDSDGKYIETARQIYKPRTGENADGNTMNVSELVSYLKNQKLRYEKGLTNDFDKDTDPKITVTAFVNEYYYEKNPITGETSKDLWKSFVNQPMREMHILSDTKISADQQSTMIGSAFTIQQSSIQTIYNPNNADLNSAWGCEHLDDEMENNYWEYNNVDYQTTDNRGNTSYTNGRDNSLKEWGVTLGTTRWETYLDLDADNSVPLMNSGYQYLRYSCMSRNRDNNGNGVIDQDEVRWYMGSINQLLGLFIGGYGIDDDARIYQRNKEQQASSTANDWRQHVISSTQDSRTTNSTQDGMSNNPLVIWGEQGCTTNGLHGSYQWAGLSQFSTRCVRNIGYDPNTGKDITYSSVATVPDDYIVVTRSTDSYTTSTTYDIDCSRVNEASLRYYTSRELDYTDENSLVACLPTEFETAPVAKAVSNQSNVSVKDMNEYLSSSLTNPYCPTGYRLPNVRELCVMFYNIPDSNFWGSNPTFAFARTYWSFGSGGTAAGTYKSGQTGYGYAVDQGSVVMSPGATETSNPIYFRCVKDVK